MRELLVGILFDTTIGNEFEKGTVVPLLENNGDGAGTKEGFPTEVTETEFEFECVTDDVLLFTVKLLFKANGPTHSLDFLNLKWKFADFTPYKGKLEHAFGYVLLSRVNHFFHQN